MSAGGGWIRFAPPKIYLCPSDSSGVNSLGMAVGTNWGDQTSTFPGVLGIPTTNYAINFQVFGYQSPVIPKSFRDGTSNTALLFERDGICQLNGSNPWGTDIDQSRAISYWSEAKNTVNGGSFDPVTNPWQKFQVQPAASACTVDSYSTQSIHVGGMNVLLADASVKLVSAGVSVGTWSACITPAAKDVLGDDW